MRKQKSIVPLLLLTSVLLSSSCQSQEGEPSTRATEQPSAKSEAEIAQQQQNDISVITQLLTTQAAAWNSADIPKFMNGYLPNDSLLFIGKSGITRGYQSTLANYLKGYPNKAAMGTLAFKFLNFTPLGEAHFFVVGKWDLTRPEEGNIGGHFSLVLKKIDGRWLIIADHSS